MNLSSIAHEERALPPLWDDNGFNTERVEWYTALVVNHSHHWGGRDVIAEFIAVMMLEAGLDNLNLGNNAKNGSDNPYIGIGWCQLDTGYHASTVQMIHDLRNDPTIALDYIVATSDLAYVGTERVWLNESRWHAWNAERIDPTDGSWSPLATCLDAYDKVTA